MLIPAFSRTMRLLAAGLLAGSAAPAQDRVLRVVSSDSEPIAYAFVQANGGHAQLTDESGRVSQQLGSVKVTAGKIKSSLELNGFYRRWLDGQKGAIALWTGNREH
jgi:hypothetical protein